ALPIWLVTTTKHECQRQQRIRDRTVLLDPLNSAELERTETMDIDGDLLAAERHEVLRRGLAELPQEHRELLLLLANDPPYSYAEISRRLDIPIGSIGPTRGRILDKLRQTTAVRAYMEATREAAHTAGGERHALAGLE